MFGDIILKLKTQIKQNFCVHDYKFRYKFCYLYDEYDVYSCSKCGKVKVDKW